ncbi:MAG: hypothetical protein HEQ35_13165 [Gloeotrichia echinulata IR180]
MISLKVAQGVLYCPTEDVSAWVKTLEQVLVNPNIAPAINLRLAEAEKYSWSHHTQIIAQSYLQLF